MHSNIIMLVFHQQVNTTRCPKISDTPTDKSVLWCYWFGTKFNKSSTKAYHPR